MNSELKAKIIETCDKKILSKGDNVGISFYAFFKNKNDNPALLMEAATWWIQEHRLDHFEKAVKIQALVKKVALKKAGITPTSLLRCKKSP